MEINELGATGTKIDSADADFLPCKKGLPPFLGRAMNYISFGKMIVTEVILSPDT